MCELSRVSRLAPSASAAIANSNNKSNSSEQQHFYPLGTLKDFEGSYSFLLSFRATFFYPANLFKRTFNSSTTRLLQSRTRTLFFNKFTHQQLLQL